MKVTQIEIKQDKNGNNMKVTTFENGDKVFVNSKYDAPIYEKVEVGADFEIVQDGNFTKIKYDKPAGGGRTAMMERTMDKKAQQIATAQGNKEEAIKIASCNRMALDTALAEQPIPFERADEFQKRVKYWKAWYYTRWDEINNQDVTPFD